jgi:sugar phosphate isomerase/epimerase
MREIVVPTFLSLFQPIRRTLQQIAASGVRLVELHGDAPATHIDITDEAAVTALLEILRELSLKVHSVHCAFSKPTEEDWDISQPDVAGREAALRRRAQVIESAARLGARHVVVHPGVRQRGRARLANSRAALAALAERARPTGVKIAVENLPPDHLGGCLADMEGLLDGLDPAAVGCCLDTGHALLGDDPLPGYLAAFGPRLLGIHWHSNDGPVDAHLFPEADDAKWDDFLAGLDAAGYRLPVTIEAVPPFTASLADALRPLRPLLSERRPATRAAGSSEDTRVTAR